MVDCQGCFFTRYDFLSIFVFGGFKTILGIDDYFSLKNYRKCIPYSITSALRNAWIVWSEYPRSNRISSVLAPFGPLASRAFPGVRTAWEQGPVGYTVNIDDKVSSRFKTGDTQTSWE